MLVFILLTAFLFINASSSTTRFGMMATRVDLNKVCSQTQNPSFCIRALNSDPRTATADLHGITAISIDLADASVKRTSVLISTLVARTSDVQLKQRYDECSKHYAVAIVDFGSARLELAHGDLKMLGSHAMDAVEQVEDCHDQFQVPPPDPSSLPQKNNDDIDLATMVFNIAGLLARSV